MPSYTEGSYEWAKQNYEAITKIADKIWRSENYDIDPLESGWQRDSLNEYYSECSYCGHHGYMKVPWDIQEDLKKLAPEAESYWQVLIDPETPNSTDIIWSYEELEQAGQLRLEYV